DLARVRAPLHGRPADDRVRELLGIDDDRYLAILSAPAGSANSGLLCQQILEFMGRTYPDRFAYADCTNVERVGGDNERVTLDAGGHRVTAQHVALCTNGFVDHTVEDAAGWPVRLAPDQQIVGRVAYMIAFVEDAPRPPAALSYIRNVVIGGKTPY